MDEEPSGAFRRYLGVMVSSTFRHLREHRVALMDALEGSGLHAVAMEQDSAKPNGTVLDSSLQKVRDSAAYVGIIARDYGQVPETADNPDGLSLTELEFREARRLGRPILLFVMSSQHQVVEDAIELDVEKRRKLAAFREEAKRATAGSSLHRVYCEFDDLYSFATAANRASAELRRHLDSIHPDPAVDPEPGSDGVRIAAPPQLYAKPHYPGLQHPFVGRAAQIARLSDWARAADPHAILLYEAIGGSGKSMLTWEWTTRHATAARPDWAGRFWYSFYESGAVMADFCRNAFAYMTGRPLRDLAKVPQRELSEQLLQQLQARPWLLVLDGLERILVAYHREEAPRLPDERAGAEDAIADRNPCAAIRSADDDLLARLAGAAPSKILITSRLVPRVLLNRAAQPVPGVLHDRLPGLRPADAELLLRSCGVDGDSATIQDYLQRHCDCHPLVVGVIGGLVAVDYLPARGDFDRWAADPDHGGRLDLYELDLTAKRNHILGTAFDALPEQQRRLLALLCLLRGAVDYPTLAALNPLRPPEPIVPPAPPTLDATLGWDDLTDRQRERWRANHDSQLREHEASERAHRAWQAGHSKADRELARVVTDLERRGLLQYDRRARRHDLHPVVRAVATGRLRGAERAALGQRVVDYFSTRDQRAYTEAASVDELRDALTVVNTLLQMEQWDAAAGMFRGELGTALVRLDAHVECLAILRPYFPEGWGADGSHVDEEMQAWLRAQAGLALSRLGQPVTSGMVIEAALRFSVDEEDWAAVRVRLSNLSVTLYERNQLATSFRYLSVSLALAEFLDQEHLFVARLRMFEALVASGRSAEAHEMWAALDPMGRTWSVNSVLPGTPEIWLAQLRWQDGILTEANLRAAERITRTGHNRYGIRQLRRRRGNWLLQRGDYAAAADCFADAVRMAREASIPDRESESLLAMARLRTGDLTDPRAEIERLSAQLPLSAPPEQAGRNVLLVAELWEAIGDTTRATELALRAYRWAWADGEPHVHWFELVRATELLRRVDVTPPEIPPCEPIPEPEWLRRIEAKIAELRAEREADGPSSPHFFR